jgi:cytochrome P450
VVEDLDFHGIPMRRGDVVALPSFLSSSEPRDYADPHVVDIDRPPHMTLETGIHLRLGHLLAKAEMRTVLEQFLGRFRNIRIPERGNVARRCRGVWGFTRLPLIWD